MSIVRLPYGKSFVEAEIPDQMLRAVLTSELHHYQPVCSQIELVKQAMAHPIASEKLEELARNKMNIVIIASDHTRPVPSKIIIPLLLEEIRKSNQDANITILIATGCHRDITREELVGKFGEEIVRNESILIHNCDDETGLVNIGILPSGGQLLINKMVWEADLLISEGFIEPHFFAGFSGSRKSVLPGIAGRNSILANHCSEFIAHPKARTGVLEDNPIHIDMVYAAEQAKLAYIVNVVINARKEVIFAVAGQHVKAHEKGCEFLNGLCQVENIPSDIVVTTNGGYPLDQNIYQAVKGMTTAECMVKQNGVIIMLAESGDGHGGDEFYRTFKEQKDLDTMMSVIMSRGRNETIPDQWQSQIFARILQHAKIIYLSDAPDEMVRDLHMIPAKSFEQALALAVNLTGLANPVITVIPDGVSTIVL